MTTTWNARVGPGRGAPTALIAAALALATLLGAAPGSAATLLAYANDGNPVTLAPTAVTAGVEAGDVARGPGLKLQNPEATAFNSRNWTVGGDKETAVAAGSFLAWEFTAARLVTLETLFIGFHSSLTGPGQVAIDLALDGGDFAEVFATTIDGPELRTAAIDLSGLAPAGAAAFRLVGWDATGAWGMLRLMDADVPGLDGRALVVTGTVAPIPLPPALPLLGAGLLLLAGLRRRPA